MLPIPFDHPLYLIKIVQLQFSRGKQAERNVTNYLHVSIAASHHENVSLSGIVHYLSGPKHARPRSKHSQHHHGRRLNPICQPNTPRRLSPICQHHHGRRLNPICQPNTPRRRSPICQPNTPRRLSPICQPKHATETQSHLSTQHRAPRQRSARASERSVRHGWKLHFGLQCSRLEVATDTKIVVAGERPDLDASSHHRYGAGAPSVLQQLYCQKWLREKGKRRRGKKEKQATSRTGEKR